MNKQWRNLKLFLRSHVSGITALVFTVLANGYMFWTIPKGLSNSEFATFRAAESLEPDQATHFIYYGLVNISTVLFGENAFALRLPSILLGIIAALLFWQVIRRSLNAQVGNWMLIMVATSGWLLHVSRLGTPLVTYFFWPSALLYVAMRIIQNREEWLWYVLAGIVIGLTLYTPGTIYVVLPLFFVGVYLVHKNHWKINRQAGTLGLIAFISVASLFVVSLVVDVSQWKSFLLIPESFNITATSFYTNIGNLLQAIFWQNDVGFEFGLPNIALLSLPEMALGLLGGLIVVMHLPSIRSVITVWYGVLVLLIFGIFGLPPSLYILALIGAYVAIAIGLSTLQERWKIIFPNNPAARSFGRAVLLGLSTIVALFHIYNYFGIWAQLPAARNEFKTIEEHNIAATLDK
ncbi:glycosyltransferase family 39 protein [Candidatus Saccharibacteria bacterium]|jgi:4-amino-4-deoxy-L-arabinose transferase-like glycosyltransferase|nr:glycosyltransferase family 39 protein [Candidatus Saccharibacteria bacterium]